MPRSPRNPANTRSFIDFASKLSAKWRLGTTPTKLQAPTVSGDVYESMEAILAQLVGFPTVTGSTEPIHDALDYIQTYLRQRGMHTKRLEQKGVESLIATTRNTKTPTVLLAAHIDVVAAAEDLFTMRTTINRLHGRGVLDMKSAIAAFMQLVDTLAPQLADYDLGVLITSDEEAGGGEGVAFVVDKGYLPQVCVLPDGGDNWQIQTFSKGIILLSVAAEGKAAHGSRPWLGKNAIDMVMAAVVDIKQFFPQQATDTNTINVGKIIGGKAINQVADAAEALLDIRVLNDQSGAELLEHIEAVCKKHGVNMTVMETGAATAFSLQNPYIASFAQAIADVAGVTVEGSSTMGTNDARFYAAKGIPCISYYPPGGGHHGPEEWIDRTAFHQSYEIIKRFVEEYARV